MCGIHGIISDRLTPSAIKDRLRHMGKAQAHRGPDDEKNEVYPFNRGGIGFGFVRLSILDLETGMQPICAPKDRTSIICNGQIYNYIELKGQLTNESFLTKGDIEVALHLYRQKGIPFLNDLNGMYAGAIYDPVRNKVVLFRDRFGIKPLYYVTWNGHFAFASEIKALLAGCQMPPQINRKALSTYFTYRYYPGQSTLFEGIMRVPPGSYLEYDLTRKTYRVKRYWEYQPEQSGSSLTRAEAAEAFVSLFKDAVKIRQRSDVEVGALLSGGIDSSAVTAVTAMSRPRTHVFTIAFENKAYNELPDVLRTLKAGGTKFKQIQHHTRICQTKGFDHLREIVAAIEEPISLGAVIPTDQVCRLASEKVKTVLTGEGADEIFAGYRKFMVEMAAHAFAESNAPDRETLLSRFPELIDYLPKRHPDPFKRYIQSERLFSRQELHDLLDLHTISLQDEEDLPILNGQEHPLNAAIAMESRFRLPHYVILRLDKLAMRHSLEARTPFLDYRLAEFAATLPVDFKVNLNNQMEKDFLRYAFEKHRILDPETAFRRKQPFTVPLTQWLSNPTLLPDDIQDILFGTCIKDQGILNPQMVAKLVHDVAEKGVGPSTLVSKADRLYSIIVFTLWIQEFFDK